MPTSGRGKTLYPSKHRIAIRSQPEGGFLWEILAPAPSPAVLAVCQKEVPYTRARDAERQAERFFEKHKVDFLLTERKIDFSQQPCTTPRS